MGIDPAGLAPLANLPPMLALTVTELEALARMGPDAFESWALKGWVKGQMGRTETGPVPLFKLRLMLRSKKRRLGLDIARYGALFPTPLINQQLAEWRSEFAVTARDLRGVQRRIDKGER